MKIRITLLVAIFIVTIIPSCTFLVPGGTVSILGGSPSPRASAPLGMNARPSGFVNTGYPAYVAPGQPNGYIRYGGYGGPGQTAWYPPYTGGPVYNNSLPRPPVYIQNYGTPLY